MAAFVAERSSAGVSDGRGVAKAEVRQSRSAAKSRNWMKTDPPEGRFVYFRLYGPTEPWIDKSWSLPDIEPIAP